MVCKRCKIKPAFKILSGEKLCTSCFLKYFERKVMYTISNFKLIDKKDKVCVAISGGKDSLAVLYLLNKIATKHRQLKLLAILIDEGIKRYREHTIKDAKSFCKKNKIDIYITSFKKHFGYTLDKIINLCKEKKLNYNPCTICGVFRRFLLNKAARELSFNKLATGHNLDDECQSILMNQFKNNIETSARLGPITGIISHKQFIKRIKPLYLLSEKETAAYSFIKKFTSKFNECPYSAGSYRSQLRDFLNEFESKYPGTKNGIIKSFLKILPMLKKHYAYEGKEIKSCKICKEPCSMDICNACKIFISLKTHIKNNRKYK